MKCPGNILSLGEKVIEGFRGFSSFLNDYFNVLVFNFRAKRHRHPHIACIACPNNQNLWLGRQNIIDISGVQKMSFLPPPVIFYITLNDFELFYLKRIAQSGPCL